MAITPNDIKLLESEVMASLAVVPSASNAPVSVFFNELQEIRALLTV